MVDFSDRRVGLRISVENVSCYLSSLDGLKRYLPGTVANISERGLRVVCKDHLPLLESYRITVNVPYPYKELSLKGKIMWGQSKDTAVVRGIQFHEGGSGLGALKEYVNANIAQCKIDDRRKERRDRRTSCLTAEKREKSLPVTIAGAGFYVPDTVVTNKEYEKNYGVDSSWIVKATGVEERRIALESQSSSDLGAIAAQRALRAAGISPDEVDLIIFVSTGGDFISPPSACLVQKLIRARNASAFDINAACMGSIWGIHTASAYIANDIFRTVLVVASDVTSRGRNFEDKNTFILLGDGAGAVVLRKNEHCDGRGVLASCSAAKGDEWYLATVLAGTKYLNNTIVGDNPYHFRMEGLEIYKFAIDIIPSCINKVMEKAGLKKEDVKRIIPHQANLRILESAQKRSGFPMEKFFINVQKYGNTASATITIALADAIEQGAVKRDDIVILVGFGAGLAWGATAIKL